MARTCDDLQTYSDVTRTLGVRVARRLPLSISRPGENSITTCRQVVVWAVMGVGVGWGWLTSHRLDESGSRVDTLRTLTLAGGVVSA